MSRIIVLTTLVVLGILGFAHAVVYESLITIVSLLWPGLLSWHAIILLRIIFIVLTLSFTVMVFCSFYLRNILTKILYKLSAIWTGILMYLFFAAFAYGALIFLNNSLLERGSVAGFSIHGHAFLFSKIGLALFVAALAVGIYGVINAGKTVVTKVSVKLSGLSGPANLPVSWKNKKVVWISDVHLGHVWGPKFLEKTVRKIQELKPDIVFIGGDLFDGTKIDEDAAIAPLRDLCAPVVGLRTPNVVRDGVYFVMGNHEELVGKNTPAFLGAVKHIPGLRVLEDEVVTVEGVDIIGVDHGHVDTPEKFSKVLAQLKKGERPSILLNTSRATLTLRSKPASRFKFPDTRIADRCGPRRGWRGSFFPATTMVYMNAARCKFILPAASGRGDRLCASERSRRLLYSSSGSAWTSAV